MVYSFYNAIYAAMSAIFLYFWFYPPPLACTTPIDTYLQLLVSYLHSRTKSQQNGLLCACRRRIAHSCRPSCAQKHARTTYWNLEVAYWKGMVPPCLVLVINDNPYGLMVALSYTWKVIHKQCLKTICWFQGWKKKIICWPRCYSWSYPKIGHVRVEPIASMSWRRRLCEHSCCLQDIIFMKREG